MRHEAVLDRPNGAANPQRERGSRGGGVAGAVSDPKAQVSFSSLFCQLRVSGRDPLVRGGGGSRATPREAVKVAWRLPGSGRGTRGLCSGFTTVVSLLLSCRCRRMKTNGSLLGNAFVYGWPAYLSTTIFSEICGVFDRSGLNSEVVHVCRLVERVMMLDITSVSRFVSVMRITEIWSR